MLQFIDPDSTLRMDVFRACGGTMTRTVRLDLPSAAIQLISLEDLTARTARLVLDLAEGIPVLSKHARDFLGFVNLVDKAEVETAWQDHRKPNHPMTFQETISLHSLAQSRRIRTCLSLPNTRTLRRFAPLFAHAHISVGEPKRDPVLVGVLVIVRREWPCR